MIAKDQLYRLLPRTTFAYISNFKIFFWFMQNILYLSATWEFGLPYIYSYEKISVLIGNVPNDQIHRMFYRSDIKQSHNHTITGCFQHRTVWFKQLQDASNTALYGVIIDSINNLPDLNLN